MIASVHVTNYGADATAALADELIAAKGANPLAAVTVVVPSNTVGLSARRLLGAQRQGIVNVNFVTPFRLAEILGRRAIAEQGLDPLTNPLLAAAVREQLDNDPGFFAPVAGHVATEAALSRCYGELSRARPATIERLQESGSVRAQAVVAFFLCVRKRLKGYADEDALAHSACKTVERDQGALDALGEIILFLPQPCSPGLADLLKAVLARAKSRAIIGWTGAADADAAVQALCDHLGIALTDRPASTTTATTSIVRVADPDEEVRAAVRKVAAAAESGIALDRIGIFFPAPTRYARTVHEQLTDADIPHNAPPIRRLDSSLVGRTLLRLTDLVDADLRRNEVIALLTSAPVRDASNNRVPSHLWDVLSRKAGVVSGQTEWVDRLGAFATERRARAAEQEAEGRTEGAIAATLRDADEAEALAAFVADFAPQVDASRIPSGWSGHARWASDLLARILGDERSRERWPTSEADAADRVAAILERLAVLDDIEPSPSFAVFRRALSLELEAPMERVGRFGEGVVCGSLALGLGLDLDLVIVLGLVEGTCPAPRREDSLLNDADRELAVDAELALRIHAIRDTHRQLLATIAAGANERLLLSPRGEHRTGRGLGPSRWLLDIASELQGKGRVFTSTFDDLGVEDGLTSVASFVSGTRDAVVHASLADRDLARLLVWNDRGGDIAAHPVAAATAVQNGIEAIRARASDSLTRWDGNLEGCDTPAPTKGEVVSATRLEGWAACPFRYFLGSVLHLGDIEEPEQIVELSALDRGSLVHAVLERFMQPVVDQPAKKRIAPRDRWSDDDRARMVDLARDVCAEYEAAGKTGKPLLWRIQSEELIADLLMFLDKDNEYRKATGAVPESVEMAFGFDGQAPVVIKLGDGRELSFRGRADRVDRASDGSLKVIDYKTGSTKKYDGIGKDPVMAGTLLQLPLYAAAARAQLDGGAKGSGLPPSANYWFATRTGDFKQVGYTVDDEVSDRFVAVLSEIACGIEEGVFAAVPGAHNTFFGTADNCGFCAFDRLCPSDRVACADAKAEAPEKERIYALQPSFIHEADDT